MISFMWRTSRVRLAYLHMRGRQCWSDCNEGHTYRRGCLMKAR